MDLLPLSPASRPAPSSPPRRTHGLITVKDIALAKLKISKLSFSQSVFLAIPKKNILKRVFKKIKSILSSTVPPSANLVGGGGEGGKRLLIIYRRGGPTQPPITGDSASWRTEAIGPRLGEISLRRARQMSSVDN